MSAHTYVFAGNVAMEDVSASLLLSIFGTESLHGESQMRLDADYDLDEDRRRLTIGASTEVGRDLNRLFVGFLRREFGEQSFRVDRVSEEPVSA